LSLFSGIRYFLLSDKSKYQTLKDILGFYPKNPLLYTQAFTHSSAVQEGTEKERNSNERLEFLGDAVLGAIIADYFFMKYPYENEGFLSKLRAKMVNRKFLNQLSIDLGLDTFLETSASTYRSKSIFGDAFEALIGAIYLDKGYDSCKKFVIEKVIKDYINLEELVNTETNFKSKLIEYAQQNKLSYVFKINALESTYSKVFQCSLEVDGKLVGQGEGNSKKIAEQIAAEQFFTNSESGN
tara:strand:+ start:13096 stop:13815 length:720 start_codon:yes stop_codon:yes gene_type:complete